LAISWKRELPYSSVQPLVETSTARAPRVTLMFSHWQHSHRWCTLRTDPIQSISDSPSHPLHHHTSTTGATAPTRPEPRTRTASIPSSLCVTDVSRSAAAEQRRPRQPYTVHDFTLELEASSSLRTQPMSQASPPRLDSQWMQLGALDRTIVL